MDLYRSFSDSKSPGLFLVLFCEKIRILPPKKKHEEKIKTRTGNSTENVQKKSTKIGHNDKTKEKRCNM